jgi:LysR family transcriptional regulator, mexEF-oprN operon transcriptional activator
MPSDRQVTCSASHRSERLCSSEYSGKLILMNDYVTHDEYPPISFDEAVLRRIDLNLLVVFAMVFRHGSVQAAAGRLYLGSSGVSMALSRLRTITSDSLFIRGRRGLEPTAFAQSLYERVSPALSMIGAAMSPSTFHPEEATGTFRLALSEDLEIVLTTRLERLLARIAPGLKLTVRHGDYQRATSLLDDDVADVVVTARPSTVDSRHRCEDVLQETFAVLSDTDVFDPNRPITLEEYLSAPHALVSAIGTVRGRIDEALADLGLSRTVRVVTESFAALPFLLRSSGLIANVPRSAATALAEAFGLTMHELPLPSPSFPVAMTWRVRDEQNAALRWMRNLVREQLVSARTH